MQARVVNRLRIQERGVQIEATKVYTLERWRLTYVDASGINLAMTRLHARLAGSSYRPASFVGRSSNSLAYIRKLYRDGVSIARPSFTSFSRWVATFCSAPRRNPSGRSDG